TNWSGSNDIQQAGNIPFAPFANNASFFEKYNQMMLVINGVDAQTNAHSTGVIINWSGRNSVGYPTLTAVFAAKNAPSQPLSNINFGGFGQTGNLIRFTRLEDVETLRNLLNPKSANNGDATYKRTEEVTIIERAQQSRLRRLLDDPTLMPRQFQNLEAYQSAVTNKGSLSEFAAFVPPDGEILAPANVNGNTTSTLGQQVQLTAAAFYAGLASAVDLYTSGYDTHTNHDQNHEPLFSHLNESIDLLWTLAEQKGFADRMTVVIASDFGRTPWYNADNGKDHWAIGSVIVMEKNAGWTNRVVGETDALQNAYKLKPDTLVTDDSDGITILPKHVHKALRSHLGLANTSVDADFKFGGAEDFSFFS
ncbi:MAG: hypothetical protein ACI8Z1_003924, partial [Candidatus Azotimanducaceae bacterium]